MNILLATTGASPQVLTETLFAIHQSGRPFPDKVYVITTKSSLEVLLNGLFRDGHLQALKDEHGLPSFEFDESHIWLIEDHEGCQIDDAKTIEDQAYMADFITRKVFELTQDGSVSLHASLAGGRKTMAFYLGYAMSLYGRPQDTLSHVFVQNDFEFVRDFWYPTKADKFVAGKNNIGEVNCKDADVILAEIPFVRMRKSVDESLMSSVEKNSFSQTVGMMNATVSGEIEVTFDPKALLISTVGVDVKFTSKEFGFYQWVLSKDGGILVDRDFIETDEHSINFLNCYSQFKTDARVFGTFDTTPDEFRDGEYTTLKPMDKEFVQPIVSNINKKLSKVLPSEVANQLSIRSIPEQYAQRYKVALQGNGWKVKTIEM